MYTVVTRTDFHNAFNRAGRGNQFSYEALDTLFDYMEDMEDTEGGRQEEFDVIATCCEWTEYKNISEFNNENGTNFSNAEELQDGEDTVLTIEGTDRFLIANG